MFLLQLAIGKTPVLRNLKRMVPNAFLLVRLWHSGTRSGRLHRGDTHKHCNLIQPHKFPSIPISFTRGGSKAFTSLSRLEKETRSFNAPRPENTTTQPTSLEEEYGKVLSKLVQSHLPIINEFLDRAEQFTSFDKSESAIDLLDSLTNESFDVTNAIKRLARLQNVHYQEVKAARAKFERFMTPVSDYHWFLSFLYPEKGTIRYKKLYEGYQALPTPRPLHISTQHLEDLISSFMDTRKPAHRAIYNILIEDMISCGMPISVHEYNSCTFMAMSSFYEELRESKSGSLALEQIERFRNNIAQTRHTDSSTINILFGFALQSEQEELVSQALEKFQTSSISPDRVTMMIYIMNEGKKHNSVAVRGLYEEMCSKGYVIDISVLNVLLKSLLLCGDIEGAENIFASITQRERSNTYPLLKSQLSYISPSSVLVKQVKLIDTTVRILHEHGISVDRKQIQVPIVPDEFTFSAMLSYYCSKDGDFHMALNILHLMEKSGIQPSFRHFSKIYDGFITNSRSRASWNRAALNQVTSMICQRYELYVNMRISNNKSDKSQIYKLYKKNLLSKAFRAYHTVFWDVPHEISEVQDNITSVATTPTTTSKSTTTETMSNKDYSLPNNEPPSTHTVYRALTKLLDVGHA